MSLVITAGQRGDSPQFQVVLGRIRVPRLGPGRPRTRPDKVRADKAYGSRANRAYLRKRGIRCTIPEKRDQITNRKKRGSHGGRPPKFDGRLQRAPRGGVRNQSPQAPPRGGNEIRQTRRPLRGDRAGHGHQRVAVTSTFETRPSLVPLGETSSLRSGRHAVAGHFGACGDSQQLGLEAETVALDQAVSAGLIGPPEYAARR